ncbi:hypothetical protein BY996DRAFT_6422302 [Phakopsora pachyrhizi]|nr:hypothetical protein BY996DRAFT_6422302 [Phakopsora pachyrhizi]
MYTSSSRCPLKCASGRDTQFLFVVTPTGPAAVYCKAPARYVAGPAAVYCNAPATLGQAVIVLPGLSSKYILRDLVTRSLGNSSHKHWDSLNLAAVLPSSE